MVTGHLALSLLCAAVALGLSVAAGHPPLAWLLCYSLAGSTALLALAFRELLIGE